MAQGTGEMTLRYLSLCSGIEAASVAWQPLGWQAVAFAEIEPFPCAVLAHHFPDVPNLGDITKIDGSKYRGAVELIVGGTPCQDFSIAGKRAGMAGERSGLAREFVRILSEVRPRWFVWENVPGVFSTNCGRDFGTFLGALDGCGYSCAWRVLDAQFFGVPQRRRRVFVVGHLGDWRPAAAVLFERESVCGHPAKGGQEGASVAATLTRGSGSNYNKDKTYIAIPINTQVALRHRALGEGTGLGIGMDGDPSFTIQAAHSHAVAYSLDRNCDYSADDLIAFHGSQDPCVSGTVTNPLGRNNGLECCFASTQKMLVRRLTPRECERLQGFPDDYTAIAYRGKPASDGPRYKALGNSMCTNVMRWIGERIAQVAQRH